MYNQTEDGLEEFVSHLILLGNVRERLEYPELRRKAHELYNRHHPDVCIIEKKASGQSLLQDLRRSGLPVQEYMPDRDKVSRVYSASPMIEAGRVWVPKGKKWADGLVDELLKFPNAAHDDQVDALVMAVHYLRDSWHLEHPEDPEWEDEPTQKKTTYWNFAA